MRTEQSFTTQIARYESFLLKEYKPSTVRHYSRLVSNFLEWKNVDDANQPRGITASIWEYIDPSNSISNHEKDFKSVRAAMHLYYYHITGTRFHPPEKIVWNEFIETEVAEYETYLSEIAGLAENTKISHRKYIRRFLYYVFFKEKIETSLLSVAKVQSFLTTELGHLRPTSKKIVIGIIRSYIRYIQFKGVELDIGLLMLPLSAPVWKLSGVPKTFEKEDIDNIHASYDLNTLVGIRDHAIALCFSEFGLRVSEVANITLDDFNWQEAKLLIKKTKTHSERELPLAKKVGEAIVQYLKNARPKTVERILFVCFSHHYGEPMGSEQIRGTIRRAYARIGISPTITGTHIFRHSKAKDMYEKGSSLKMIADVLGHESIDTTVIYTKVGRSALYCVTCPWPVTSAPEVGHE